MARLFKGRSYKCGLQHVDIFYTDAQTQSYDMTDEDYAEPGYLDNGYADYLVGNSKCLAIRMIYTDSEAAASRTGSMSWRTRLGEQRVHYVQRGRTLYLFKAVYDSD